MPLTIWAFFVTAILGVLSFPVLLSAALLLIMDRSFGTSFYLSDIYIAGEALANEVVVQFYFNIFLVSRSSKFILLFFLHLGLLQRLLLLVLENQFWI